MGALERMAELTEIDHKGYESSLGFKGSLVIADAAAHAASAGTCFSAIQALTDTVIAAHTSHASAPLIADSLAGITIGAGIIVYGKFTSITLTSGTVIAYKADL